MMIREFERNSVSLTPFGSSRSFWSRYPQGKRCKGVNELQFQIKGQDYFLAFVEQEKRWYVFAPTPAGVHRIPVYVDAPVYERVGSLENGRHNVQN